MWTPDLTTVEGPRYLAIADALASDIGAGRLGPGERLPTHRDLADALGVTVGTVTRAYRAATERGLINGEVGRGTFVRGDRSATAAPYMRIRDPRDRSSIDLSLNFLRLGNDDHTVVDALTHLRDQDNVGDLFAEYHPQAGLDDHRRAGSRFVAQSRLEVDPTEILVCSGAQHAMTIAMLGLTRPGDVVLVGAVTYPTVITLARVLHRKLKPVAMDAEGLLPEALDAACRAHHARALYCMPSVQNPTSRVMSDKRRREIIAVAMKHHLSIIEDDVYGFLMREPARPMASIWPQGCCYVTSCSKSVAPGLRVGYLAVPKGESGRFLDALWATTVMASPPMATIATRWIDNGTAAAQAAARRVEAGARQQIAADYLEGLEYEAHPNAFHVWLALPERWRAASFVARAQQRGVAVVPGETFAVGELDRPRVRISLGAARDRAELCQALEILRNVLAGSDAPRLV